jgi:hypothetical protein
MNDARVVGAPSYLVDARANQSGLAGVVSELARDLYETEKRLEPGLTDNAWEMLDDYTRAFYVECVWSLLSRTSLLTRFFKLTDRNVIVGSAEATEEPNVGAEH